MTNKKDLNQLTWNEQVPPNDLEAEQAILGGLLFQGELIKEVRPILPQSNMFYSAIHQHIYQKILEVADEELPIDMVILGGKLDAEIVNKGYLAELVAGVATTVNIRTWAERVREQHYLREILMACQTIGMNIFQHEKFTEIMSKSKAIIEKINSEALSLMGVAAEDKKKEFEQAVEDTYDDIESMQSRELDFPTGIKIFDKRVGGFWDGDLIVIGGATSSGKTALALTACRHLLPMKKHIAYFSLEMGQHGLIQRLMQMDTEVDLGHGHIRFLDVAELEKLYDFKIKAAHWNFTIFDDLEADTDIEKWVQLLKPDILFIDHLQLIITKKLETRTQELTSFVRHLKKMARKYNIPIVALSQLRKEAEGRVPLVNDLYESGGIGQNADQVLLLYRPGLYGVKGEEHTINETKLYVAKNRHGAVGTLPLYFSTDKLQFFDTEPNRIAEPNYDKRYK